MTTCLVWPSLVVSSPRTSQKWKGSPTWKRYLPQMGMVLNLRLRVAPVLTSAKQKWPEVVVPSVFMNWNSLFWNSGQTLGSRKPLSYSQSQSSTTVWLWWNTALTSGCSNTISRRQVSLKSGSMHLSRARWYIISRGSTVSTWNPRARSQHCRKTREDVGSTYFVSLSLTRCTRLATILSHGHPRQRMSWTPDQPMGFTSLLSSGLWTRSCSAPPRRQVKQAFLHLQPQRVLQVAPVCHSILLQAGLVSSPVRFKPAFNISYNQTVSRSQCGITIPIRLWLIPGFKYNWMTPSSVIMNRIEVVATALATDYFGQTSLPAERDKSGICPKELEAFLFGKHNSARKETFEFLLANKKVFSHSHLNEESRSECRLTSALKVLKLKEHLDAAKLKNYGQMSIRISAITSYDLAISVKFGVHYYLYYKTLYYLGTERHQEFRKRALALEDIGCFGLTEIMHGSNVRGVLTEAHYDHSTKEFVLNSGGEYGMKFWIGAAANLANISCIWAQLFVDGKNHGVHAFIVPIRELATHTPAAGVTVGDCGPKMGLNSIDNGFIILKNVRIPKNNLLNRFSDVDDNGKFVTKVENPDKRFGLQLGALSGGRVLITLSSTIMSEIALTIATRYAMLRKQFGPPNKKETTIFQYPLTKARLLPLICQALVQHLGGIELHEKWFQAGMKIIDPKNNEIEFLHAISSVMKPITTWFANSAIDQSRQVMGGHGYSSFSRIGTLFNDNHIHMTWEGDNNVLLMQTQKFVTDAVKKIAKGKPIHSSLEFIRTRRPVPPADSLQDLDSIVAVFQNRVLNKLDASIAALTELLGKGVRQEEATAQLQSFSLARMAINFGQLHYLRNAIAKTKTMNQPLKSVMQNCTRVFAYKLLRQQGYGCEEVKGKVNVLFFKYIDLVVPHTARLVDAFAPPADIIGSPFAYEDKPFERYISLLNTAKGTYQRVPWWKEIHGK